LLLRISCAADGRYLHTHSSKSAAAAGWDKWTQDSFMDPALHTMQAMQIGQKGCPVFANITFYPRKKYVLCTIIKVKVKFSHTRYRALGPELIPVYRQSARR